MLHFATMTIRIYDYLAINRLNSRAHNQKSKIAELKKRMDAKMEEICVPLFSPPDFGVKNVNPLVSV